MSEICYISVIIPLKLEWEPCYSVVHAGQETDIKIGDRVRVIFAGKEYIGVVSSTDCVPETDASRIKNILSVERHLDSIFPEEIELWRQVADYYMCTVGEVYKAAYPTHKTSLEEAKGKSSQRASKASLKESQARKSSLKRQGRTLPEKHIPSR